ncbi:hypothetical protein Q4E93_31615 [Flavitalea sp. BT771]|uniref:hypothetical protein n=1 Tax=Flavitalea sp. BT771 TaxID=3063329 RepID=UPI0026E2945B|nr:hypothetical protein [Flavitalea sp. BT771]MDO6435207.1 hypothetical protein [Flavitalea sp. BT771]MDV6224088.1 hypothetical protein [Flavitalea sp. BT771]
MKKILMLALLVTVAGIAVKAQLNITGGTHLVTSGNAHVVVNDLDLIVPGTLDATGSVVHFSGSGDNSITGAGSQLTFNSLAINKSMGGKLVLKSDVMVQDTLHFISGMIELNQQSVNLGNTGTLAGESETSHFTGQNGGVILANAILNAPNAANIGNLGVTITSSQNLGTVYVNRYHSSSNIPASSGKSVLTRYDINPGGPAIDGVLTFHYFDADLNGIGKSHLTIYATPDDVTFTDLHYSAKDTILNTITQKGLSNITGTYTLGSQAIVLPVRFTDLTARCKGKYIELTWRTAAEQNSERFDVQRSQDGRMWETIGSVKAAGNSSSIMDYGYKDLTLNMPSALYRLAQYDIDNRISYSSILEAGCALSTEFRVMPNPVVETARVTISGASSGKGELVLSNAAGWILWRQAVTINTGINQYPINTSALARGVYYLALLRGGASTQTIGIIKQ